MFMISGEDLGKIRMIWEFDEDLGRFRELSDIIGDYQKYGWILALTFVLALALILALVIQGGFRRPIGFYDSID